MRFFAGLGALLALASVVGAAPTVTASPVLPAKDADAKHLASGVPRLRELATSCANDEVIAFTYCVHADDLAIAFEHASDKAATCMRDILPPSPSMSGGTCGWIAFAVGKAKLPAAPTRKHDLQQLCDSPKLAGVTAEPDAGKRAAALMLWLTSNLQHPDVADLLARAAGESADRKREMFVDALRAEHIAPDSCRFLR